MENRKKALEWWKKLALETKEQLFAEYKPYTFANNLENLTGREIQNIWAVYTKR